MSRIGKTPIEIPADTKIEVLKDEVRVLGPKGTLTVELKPQVDAKLANGQIQIKRKNDTKLAKSLHGLTRTLVYNAVVGVTSGWEKILEVVGTGFSARVDNGKLILKLGFSHPVEFIPPESVNFNVFENKIKIEGADKAKVGQIAAKIRAFASPNKYSGKGIRYLGEKLKLKPGKAAKALSGVKT